MPTILSDGRSRVCTLAYGLAVCFGCVHHAPLNADGSGTVKIRLKSMFENLQEKLQRAFKSLRGQAVLTEENISEALKQIRLALLEADVNFKVVKELIDRIQAKAVGQEVLTALSPGEQVIKIVR